MRWTLLGLGVALAPLPAGLEDRRCLAISSGS
jgi:hypothetical protein